MLQSQQNCRLWLRGCENCFRGEAELSKREGEAHTGDVARLKLAIPPTLNPKLPINVCHLCHSVMHHARRRKEAMLEWIEGLATIILWRALDLPPRSRLARVAHATGFHPAAPCLLRKRLWLQPSITPSRNLIAYIRTGVWGAAFPCWASPFPPRREPPRHPLLSAVVLPWTF